MVSILLQQAIQILCDFSTQMFGHMTYTANMYSSVKVAVDEYQKCIGNWGTYIVKSCVFWWLELFAVQAQVFVTLEYCTARVCKGNSLGSHCLFVCLNPECTLESL
jgi:hypothetical protein